MPTRTEKKVKGLRAFTVIDKTTLPGKLFVLPTPTAPEIDPGITQLLGITKNDLGEDTVESIEIVGQQPLLTVTFPSVTPQLLALRYMRQLETVTSAPFVVEKTLRVTKGTYAGVATGKFGDTMTADQAGSKMSVIGALGEITPLTRVAFASFDAETDDTFAQGEDGAFKVADNIIGSDVAYSFPFTQNGLSVSEAPITDMDISMLVTMTDLKIFRVEIPSVTVDFEGSGAIPVGAGEFSLTFRPLDNGSTCVPIKYTFIGQAIAC
jgi:hypothetical protein